MLGQLGTTDSAERFCGRRAFAKTVEAEIEPVDDEAEEEEAKEKPEEKK